jgi:hypothetical protein
MSVQEQIDALYICKICKEKKTFLGLWNNEIDDHWITICIDCQFMIEEEFEKTGQPYKVEE